MNRRESLARLSAAVLGFALSDRRLLANAPPDKPQLTVYKSPSCGCCGAWVRHVKANGFEVVEVNVENVDAYRKKFAVPADLVSCHTATVQGYAFEGHVPADLIRHFLAKPVKGAGGLAVGGMPLGSPGMEVGNRKDVYDVVLFKRDGTRSVYARR